MALRVELAGRVRVERDGNALDDRDLPGRQGRLVFGYLAANRRRVPRHELAEAVWPDALPRAWERDLSAVISKLRAVLGRMGVDGDGGIVSASGWYELDLPAGSEVDVEQAAVCVEEADAALRAGRLAVAVEAAGRAAAIARGVFLPGLDGAWVEDRRRGLRMLLGRGLEVRSDALAASGDLVRATDDMLELVALDPFRETSHARLIRLHLAAGNRAEALRAYERCRVLLVEELGVGPGAEVETAYLAALHADHEPHVRAVAPPWPALTDRTDLPFVGREEELQRLHDRFAQACAGNTEVVLVTGEPGIGKTRLTEVLATSVGPRAKVVVGRCDEESVVPYQPFPSVLRSLLAESNGPGAPHLSPDEVGLLRRIVPDMAGPDPPATMATPHPELDRYRLFEAVAALVRAATESRPHLLVLDDLQWADRTPVLLLRHLLRPPGVGPVLVVCVCRDSPTPVPEALRSAMADVDGTERLERIELRGLAEEEVSSLLTAAGSDMVGPSSTLTGAVRSTTGGNPYFVRELIRQLIAHGGPLTARSATELLQEVGVPLGVREVVRRNLARLSDDTRQALSVASVIGEEFDLGLLCAATRMADERLVDALEEASAARLAVEVDGMAGRWRHQHALVRETLYGAMSSTRKARLHRRVAGALEAQHGQDVDTVLGPLTHHLAEAATPGHPGRAVEFAERAAKRALEQLAYDEAAHLFRMALELLDLRPMVADATRCRLLLGLATACNRAGLVGPARHALDEAVECARRTPLPAQLAEAALAYGDLLLDEGLEGGTANLDLVRLLEEALGLYRDDDNPLRARLLARLGLELYFSSESGQRRRALLDEAEAMARRTGDPDALHGALIARYYELLGTHEVRDRLAVADELVGLLDAGGAPVPRRWHVREHLETGDMAAAGREIERFAAQAERYGVASYHWYPKLWAAMQALLQGPLDAVEDLAEQALMVGQQARGPDAVMAVYSAQLFTLRLLQGRLHEIEGAMADYAAASPGRPVWRAALAFAQADGGRIDEARHTFESLVRSGLASLPRDVDWPATATLLAWTCGRLGDARRAALLYDMVLPHAELFVIVGVTPSVCAGSFQHPLGVLAATAGQLERADQHFRRAVAAAESLDARPWAALARLDHAMALLGSGVPADDRGRGRRLLAEARGLAAEHGLAGVERRARGLSFGPAPPVPA